MAWGPQGKWEESRLNFKTKQETEDWVKGFYAQRDTPEAVLDWLSLINPETDEGCYYEEGHDNHRGYQRLVCRRRNELTIAYVISSFMS